MKIPDNLKTIGKVMDAHGLRGDLYILVFSGDVSWVSEAETLFLENEQYEIARTKPFKKGFIVKLKNVDDRTQAEGLKGSAVQVPGETFTSEDGEGLYLSELQDFTVIDAALGPVGQVKSFSSNGLQDLLQIPRGEKLLEIPFVEDFVANIDFEKKEIHMKLPEGLLEINDEDV